jgi:hypothetical protein
MQGVREKKQEDYKEREENWGDLGEIRGCKLDNMHRMKVKQWFSRSNAVND